MYVTPVGDRCCMHNFLHHSFNDGMLSIPTGEECLKDKDCPVMDAREGI